MRAAALIVLMLTAVAACVWPTTGEAATLKARSVTDRSEITLGDLWSDLPQALAERSVGQAPPPGQKLTFDTARLQALAEANNLDWQPVTRVERATVERTSLLVSVPVLTRPVPQGEVLRAADIGFEQMRADRLNRMVITETTQLVGKTAKRALPAAQPLRASDLTATLMVTKNSPVTVRLISSHMNVIMEGKALEDGADGDLVRVLNIRSNKVIQGVVRGAGQVQVQGDSPLAVN